MDDKNNHNAELEPIHQNSHRLLSELLHSAKVFATSHDVTLGEYCELIQILQSKPRQALVLVDRLGRDEVVR